MRLKTKKRYNHKKTHKRHNHKRRVQTKKRCHRGGAPEDSYVDFIDADHSGGIHVRYNESNPAKMWLIGPSSRPWTFRILSEGVGMWGKNGRYKPFIDAWNQDAVAQKTHITRSDFLYPKEDVDSSYGMVISDNQFKRIFIEGVLSIMYPELDAKYRKLKMADADDAVLVESHGPSVRNYLLNPFLTPTPYGPFEKKSLVSFFAPGPAPTPVPVPSMPQPAPQLDLTLVPSTLQPRLGVSSTDATALIRASLDEIRAIRTANEYQFRNLQDFDDKLDRLGDKLLHIFGPNCTNYHEFEDNLYNPSNDPKDPLYFKMFSEDHKRSEYTKFLDGQKSLLMAWSNKSIDCTGESPNLNQFIGTTFDTSVPYRDFQTSFQEFAERSLLLRVDTKTLGIRDNHTIIEVADDGWCFYRAMLVAMGNPAGSGQDAGAIRILREFALAISWIIVNPCPYAPRVLQQFGVDMNEQIRDYPVNSSHMTITAMELVKLISVPKLSDVNKPCLYPVLRYNIGQIAAMIFRKNIFILNDSLTECEEQYCGTDSIAPQDQIFMRNKGRNHFDVIQLSARVGPIVTVAKSS